MKLQLKLSNIELDSMFMQLNNLYAFNPSEDQPFITPVVILKSTYATVMAKITSDFHKDDEDTILWGLNTTVEIAAYYEGSPMDVSVNESYFHQLLDDLKFNIDECISQCNIARDNEFME